jgi:predicted phage gp36 major capsid-like protein
LLCCVTVAARVVPDSEGAEASLRDVLAAALDANREMARLAAVLREENARLRAENAEQAAELERVRADLAVLQRMAFGRSSERARPEPHIRRSFVRAGDANPAQPGYWTAARPAPARRDQEERLRLPQRGRRTARRPHLDRHRHRRWPA